MPSLIEEYRRSLKLPEAEEFFDLTFYRPLAFAFVKSVYRLPITPNQVTVLSMLSGLVAARFFADGASGALAWGAFWYALANVLDCADGQLARLQQSGTPLGRLVDGIADYVSSIAIFLGIGAGLAAAGTPAWVLVVAAGVSSAVHALLFDHYQSEYLSIVRSERAFTGGEIERISAELSRSGSTWRSALRTAVLRLYLAYLRLQDRTAPRAGPGPIDPARFRNANRGIIRVWSVLGPTTNRTLLIVCALAGRLDAYLLAVLLAGNAWVLLAYLLQRRVDRSLAGSEG